MTETVDSLETPALIVDRAILRRNLDRMSARMLKAGIDLRPHLKTAKSAQIGRMATKNHSGAITVSTLAEARYFAEAGFKDIFYAVGIVPAKLPGVAALRANGVDLHVVTDNLPVADRIAAVAAEGATFSVYIEIDSGGHRAGLAPDSPLLPDLARRLHVAPGVALKGVMTHGGHSYRCSTVEAIEAVAEEERSAVVRSAERIRALGIPCPTVSAGSTPTAMHAKRFDGLTEMRPGVYVFNDLDQAGIGSCGVGDLAVSVLASVIGHYPDRNQALIDAGALALSKDISAQEFMPDAGYGTLKEVPGVSVANVSQEHGFLSSRHPLPYDRLPIGGRVRVWPNHVCITAAAYGRYHVIDSDLDGGRAIVDVYDRINGW